MQLIGRVLARDCKWIKGRVVGEKRAENCFKNGGKESDRVS